MYCKFYKKQLLFLCGLLFTLTGFAQKNYNKGSIITLKGDTINGFIDYKNWRKNPSTIQFKKAKDVEAVAFTPKEILGFQVSLADREETYKAAKVMIESSSDLIDQMDEKREFNTREDDLFLLLILKGSYNLYCFEDQKLHFFIEHNSQIDELQSKIYLLKEKNNMVRNDQYKNQLSDLLKTCTKITNTEIESLKYRSSELVRILRKYDECNGLKSNATLKPEGIKLVFGFVIATDLSNLKIKSDQLDLKMNSAGNIAPGFSLTFKLPRNNKSSLFNFELLYRKYQFESKENKILDDNQHYKYHYKFTGNYIKSNIMYRHQWTLVKLQPFVNLGISQAFKLSDIDKSTTEKRFYSDFSNYADPIFTDERSYEQGINIGLGINMNKVNLELRAETTNGFSSIIKTNTSINSLFLNLNYLF